MTQRPSNVQVTFASGAGPSEASGPALVVRPRGRTVLGALGLVALVVITFAAYLRGQFILTDHDDVAANPAVHYWRAGLRTIWLEPRALPQFSPLAYTFLLAETRILGERPVVYRAAGIALHALNVVLLWLLLRRIGLPGALVAAALFAVHPIHAEPIAWASQQRVLWCATFYLIGLLWWVSGDGRSEWPILPMVAAVLCHPIGLTFPLAAAAVQRAWAPRRPLVAMGVVSVLGIVTLLVVHPPESLNVDAWPRTVARLAWPAGPGTDLADHVLYPVYGALVATIVIVIARRALSHTWAGLAAMAGVLTLALAVNTMLRAPHYRTDESFWQAALAANPDSPDALAQLGRIELRQRSSPRGAIAYFAKALQIDPTHRAALLELAAAHAALNHWDLSVARYQQLQARDPNDLDALFGLGVAFAHQNRTDEAVSKMLDVLRRRPTHARAHLELCALYRQRGDTRRALEHGEAAIRLDPRRPDPYIELATLVFTRLGDANRAQALLEHARRLDLSRPETVQVAGQIQFEIAKAQTDPARRAGAFETAVGFFREGVRLGPQSAGAHKNLGIALAASSIQPSQPPQAQLEALNEAIFCFERAESLNPSEPDVRELRNKAARDRDALSRQTR